MWSRPRRFSISILNLNTGQKIRQDIESRDAGVVYSQYIMSNLSILRDLNKVIKDFIGNGKYANAVVGALRLKMDINEKILKTGQDMGFIAKLPEGHFVINGQDLRNTSTEKLLERIAEEDAEVKELVKEMMKSTGLSKKKIGDDGKVFFLTPERKRLEEKKRKEAAKEESLAEES